eukprot:5613365-Prymnesium_polylepis.1
MRCGLKAVTCGIGETAGDVWDFFSHAIARAASLHVHGWCIFAGCACATMDAALFPSASEYASSSDAAIATHASLIFARLRLEAAQLMTSPLTAA